MSEAEPTSPASSVTTLLDDWSIEIDADHVNLGQDGLEVFDWSEEADNAPVALALMATSLTDSSNSKVPYCSKCTVLTREGLRSTARPNKTQAVPSKSTASVFHQQVVLSQSTARQYHPKPVISTRTGRPYYPRMDNVRPKTSSLSPSKGFYSTRSTPNRPYRPKKIVKSIWVKKGSIVGSQAVLPHTISVKKSAMIKQTWRQKGNYLDSVNRDMGSIPTQCYLRCNPEESSRIML
ncbi:hypothetical protein Tco_1292771 [Tanacetum coccineum]